MAGKTTLGVVAVLSVWSNVARAQAPVEAPPAAPEAPATTESAPSTPSAPPAPQTVPAEPATAEPGPDLEAPTPSPRVRWKRDPETTQCATETIKSSVGTWNFTLDPQVVLIAAPRIGITLGPLFDIPLSGTDKTEAEFQNVEYEYKSSAYGVTAGAAAIF